MNEKYEFTGEVICENGIQLQRIRALRDINNPTGFVRAGDLGGWIETMNNLSYLGNSWIFDEGCVHGQALVAGDASVHHHAEVAGIRDGSNALTFVFGAAQVREYALVSQNAVVEGHAMIRNHAVVSENA